MFSFRTSRLRKSRKQSEENVYLEKDRYKDTCFYCFSDAFIMFAF